jgi:hypothetical protein
MANMKVWNMVYDVIMEFAITHYEDIPTDMDLKQDMERIHNIRKLPTEEKDEILGKVRRGEISEYQKRFDEKRAEQMSKASNILITKDILTYEDEPRGKIKESVIRANLIDDEVFVRYLNHQIERGNEYFIKAYQLITDHTNIDLEGEYHDLYWKITSPQQKLDKWIPEKKEEEVEIAQFFPRRRLDF